MLYQIILKNFKSSWKNYFVYFTGNIIGVAEFFVFLGLYSVSKVIMKDASADFGTIQDVMFACILVCIFSDAIMIIFYAEIYAVKDSESISCFMYLE